MNKHVRHEDGMRDNRYTIRREWVGKNTPQWVARFCDVWLTSAPTQREALAVAARHQEERMAVLSGLSGLVSS